MSSVQCPWTVLVKWWCTLDSQLKLNVSTVCNLHMFVCVCDPDNGHNRLTLCFIIIIMWNDQLSEWLEPLIFTTCILHSPCHYCAWAFCFFFEYLFVCIYMCSCSFSSHFNPVINRKFDLSAIEHMAIKFKKKKKHIGRHIKQK